MSHINKIGLLFGSFDPVHIGHLIVAESICSLPDIDKVWFVISPQNPLKIGLHQTEIEKRIQMLKIAIGENPKFELSEIEIGMEAPHFTINTLTILRQRYVDHKFVLILGSDNIEGFKKWKDYDKILQMVEIYVYPRNDSIVSEFYNHASVKLISAPRIDISSTVIRSSIRKGQSIRYLLHPKVYDYITDTGLYS